MTAEPWAGDDELRRALMAERFGRPVGERVPSPAEKLAKTRRMKTRKRPLTSANTPPAWDNETSPNGALTPPGSDHLPDSPERG